VVIIHSCASSDASRTAHAGDRPNWAELWTLCDKND
jgi:hypothetical protein